MILSKRENPSKATAVLANVEMHFRPDSTCDGGDDR
jgi:hypothetical protein